MQIDAALISRLEKLSRLQLGEAEREKLTGDLQRILDMVDTLGALDTENVEPLVYLNDAVNVLRADEVGRQLTTSEALQNAPEQNGQFFMVPKMID
ncbi:MAG: Asp-tRNA(Asn)/Glu-tRNA(Gln) amidotransferase subunit GatC [Lewinellaceae bacterium]|nr:Asp-tRNA(Asn)/Glu-tRNA(Gln) amidotransferase subunit GatC [Lewinellaceae bacterium]